MIKCDIVVLSPGLGDINLYPGLGDIRLYPSLRDINLYPGLGPENVGFELVSRFRFRIYGLI